MSRRERPAGVTAVKQASAALLVGTAGTAVAATATEMANAAAEAMAEAPTAAAACVALALQAAAGPRADQAVQCTWNTLAVAAVAAAVGISQ